MAPTIKLKFLCILKTDGYNEIDSASYQDPEYLYTCWSRSLIFLDVTHEVTISIYPLL